MNSQREAFEQWAGKVYRAESVGHKSKVLARLDNGEYKSAPVEGDWRVWQAATEQGVVPVSNPDLCPICKDRQVIPDEDWCGPCREEFYDTVMESGDTDSPAEQGVGEAQFYGCYFEGPPPSGFCDWHHWAAAVPRTGVTIHAGPPKPTGGGVPDEWVMAMQRVIDWFDACNEEQDLVCPREEYARIKALLATQQPPEQE